MRAISGGTRNNIRLSRPTQQPLANLINPASCPFCTKPQEEIRLKGIPEGWRLLPNPFTPHPVEPSNASHRLIIPAACWPEEKLQTLGDKVEITNALLAAQIATENCDPEMSLFVHVGITAGQNLGHPHWHLLNPEVERPLRVSEFEELITPERTVFEIEPFTVVAGGAHGGECLVIPWDRYRLSQFMASKLAQTIANIIDLGNERFRSTQGLPPEYIVTVRIDAGGLIRYADYCPILYFWGSPHHVTAPLEGGTIPVQWPHEVTAAHLRESSSALT